MENQIHWTVECGHEYWFFGYSSAQFTYCPYCGRTIDRDDAPKPQLTIDDDNVGDPTSVREV